MIKRKRTLTGRWLKLDFPAPAWDYPVPLHEGEKGFPGWVGADYRIIAPRTGAEIPVNLTVTGRTIRSDRDGQFFRVKVTIPGDGAPDKIIGGNFYGRL